MSKIYYFDNSATSSPKPKNVIEAVCQSLTELNVNPNRGVTKNSIDAGRKIFDTRLKLAEFFKIENPLNIAFTKNSTESLNIAIKGMNIEGGHIITSVLEHNSVLRPINYLRDEKKIEVSYICPSINPSKILNDIKEFLRGYQSNYYKSYIKCYRVYI